MTCPLLKIQWTSTAAHSFIRQLLGFDIDASRASIISDYHKAAESIDLSIIRVMTLCCAILRRKKRERLVTYEMSHYFSRLRDTRAGKNHDVSVIQPSAILLQYLVKRHHAEKLKFLVYFAVLYSHDCAILTLEKPWRRHESSICHLITSSYEMAPCGKCAKNKYKKRKSMLHHAGWVSLPRQKWLAIGYGASVGIPYARRGIIPRTILKGPEIPGTFFKTRENGDVINP